MKHGYEAISQEEGNYQLRDGLESSWKTRKICLLYTSFMLVATVALIVALTSGYSLPETQSDTGKHVDTYNDDDADAESDSVVESTSNKFTFKRLGYSPLPYFDTDASTLFTYKILKGHIGVIEPHADTVFHSYGSSSTDIWWFKACSSVYITKCQEGTFTNDGGDEVSTVLNFACEAYDTFDVYVEQRSSKNEVKKNLTVSALCMPVRREIRNMLSEGGVDESNSWIMSLMAYMYMCDQSLILVLVRFYGN